MNHFFSFIDTSENKIILLRIILSLALLSTIIISPQLWHSNHSLPLAPVFENVSFTLSFNYVLLGIFFISTVLFNVPIVRKYALLLHLISFITLVLADLNRLQPEFYMFEWLVFFFLLYEYKKISPETLIAAVGLSISGVYFWSGFHKLNPHYLKKIYPLFTYDLFKYFSGSFIHPILMKGRYLTPFIEIIIGLGLVFTPYKKTFSVLALLMHLFIMLCLILTKYNSNDIVLPWNIFMALAVLVLFFCAGKKFEWINPLKKSLALKTCCIVFWFLPALNLFGKLDSYLSFSIYSGKTTEGIIYLKEYVYKRLPENIQQQVEYTKEHQYRILLNQWSHHEIKAPMYPEERVFKKYRIFFQQYADNKDDIGLVVFSMGKYKVIP